MATEYPITLNPFDSSESENDEKNPFKNSDTENNSLPGQRSVPKESSDDRNAALPIPHQLESLKVVSGSAASIDTTTERSSSQDRKGCNSIDRGSLLSISRNSDAESTKESSLPSTPRTSQKTKRQAPPVPVNSPKKPDDTSIGKPPLSYSLSPRKKKTAPLPPSRSSIPNITPQNKVEDKKISNEDLRDVDTKLENLSLKSDSRISSTSLGSARNLEVTSPEIDNLSDEENLDNTEENISQAEMKTFLELWRSLKAEQKSIETELRNLMDYPEESRTPAIISREQFLMEALLENVKKRQELEEEAEEEDRRASSTLSNTTSGSGQKRMKKRKKFRLKKLLGVQT